MAKKTTLTYRVRFYDARGRFSTVGRSKTFVISYGKRQTRYEFERGMKAADKRAALDDLIERLEREREAKLEKARQKRRVEREKITQAKRKKEAAKLEKIARKKFTEEVELKNKTIFEESLTRKSKVLGKVAITPVKVGTKAYSKRIIRKTIISKAYERDIDIRILDFTLKKKIYVDQHNAQEAASEAFAIFKPHIEKFYKESARTEKSFIFRVKFDLPMLGMNNKIQFRGQGVSVERTLKVKFIQGLFKHVQEGFDYFIEKILDKYLGVAVSKDLFITGFTLENVVRVRKTHSLKVR